MTFSHKKCSLKMVAKAFLGGQLFPLLRNHGAVTLIGRHECDGQMCPVTFQVLPASSNLLQSL